MIGEVFATLLIMTKSGVRLTAHPGMEGVEISEKIEKLWFAHTIECCVALACSMVSDRSR